MSDMRELLRAGVDGFEPTPDAFERVLARRDRKRRNERIAAGFVAAAVFALVAVWFVRLLSLQPVPAAPHPEPAPPRNGDWVVISVSSLDPGAPPMSRGRPANLFVAGPGGSARLLAGAQGDSTLQQCPAFSPDGSMLAYGQMGAGAKMLVVSGFSSAGELEGPTERIPVPAAQSFVGPCPVWAQDGQRLATIAPGVGVLIVDLTGGTHLVRVDAYGLHEGGTLDLKWSPDGSQLALLVPSAPSKESAWLIPADGGAAHALAGFDPATSGIAWTADGQSLVTVGGSCCSATRPFVEMIDVGTGEAQQVRIPDAWKATGVWGIVGSKDDRFLVWRGWDAPLAWLDLRGNATPVDLKYPMGSFPVLSPDGRQLLYVTYDPVLGPGQKLIALPLDGGPPTRYSPSTNAFGDNYATYAWQPR